MEVNVFLIAGLMVELVGLWFAVGAFRILFKVLRKSPARTRSLLFEAGIEWLLVRPMREPGFMPRVWIVMILGIVGLGLLSLGLRVYQP